MKRRVIAAVLLSLGALCATTPAYAEHCATFYLHINFGGDQRDVSVENNPWIGDLWNDQVSSIDVAPGCVLNAYEHINYGGAHKTFLGSVPWVGDDWNDKISSYTCSCH